MRQPINSKIDPLMVDFTLVKSAALSAPDLSQKKGHYCITAVKQQLYKKSLCIPGQALV
jgi:hypothetical protein